MKAPDSLQKYSVTRNVWINLLLLCESEGRIVQMPLVPCESIIVQWLMHCYGVWIRKGLHRVLSAYKCKSIGTSLVLHRSGSLFRPLAKELILIGNELVTTELVRVKVLLNRWWYLVYIASRFSKTKTFQEVFINVKCPSDNFWFNEWLDQYWSLIIWSWIESDSWLYKDIYMLYIGYSHSFTVALVTEHISSHLLKFLVVIQRDYAKYSISIVLFNPLNDSLKG